MRLLRVLVVLVAKVTSLNWHQVEKECPGQATEVTRNRSRSKCVSMVCHPQCHVHANLIARSRTHETIGRTGSHAPKLRGDQYLVRGFYTLREHSIICLNRLIW